jgi:hypothetical protein
MQAQTQAHSILKKVAAECDVGVKHHANHSCVCVLAGVIPVCYRCMMLFLLESPVCVLFCEVASLGQPRGYIFQLPG